jgi:hypothetical protein
MLSALAVGRRRRSATGDLVRGGGRIGLALWRLPARLPASMAIALTLWAFVFSSSVLQLLFFVIGALCARWRRRPPHGRLYVTCRPTHPRPSNGTASLDRGRGADSRRLSPRLPGTPFIGDNR